MAAVSDSPPEEPAARRLPETPIYPRGAGKLVSARGPASTRDKLLLLMRGGRFCKISEMLAVASAAECATAIGELLDRGHFFERSGDSFRVRARGEREARQRLVEVLSGVELASPPAPESAEVPPPPGDFNPSDDAGTEDDGEDLLVLSEPASSLSLPLEGWGGVARAILARRGSGKTYLAGVMLEEVLGRSDRPMVVVVDPGGVWWGMLSTSEGTPSSLPILLLGGPRGHLPLTSKDGAAAAEVAHVVRPVAVVLDLSLLAPVEQHELVADFCERTWALPHYPLHLVVDEADEFAPQRFGALPQQQRRSLDLLGRMVMRGRARGMGCTLISLRPAVLSKNLLSQVDELYLLRLSEPHDIGAARSWLEDFEHQVPAQQKISCLSQLPVLPTGTSYFLRGGDRPMFRRFKVREKRTHDSSRALGTGTGSRPVLSSPEPAVLEAARKILAAGPAARREEDGDAEE